MSMKYDELYQLNFNTSLAHTIGNVTTLFLEHFKNQFPNKFYKSFYVDTTMDQKQFIEKRKSFLDLKKPKPILSISPKIDTSRPEFASTSFFNLRYGKNLVDGRRNPTTVSTLLYSKDHRLGVDFSINRLRLNVDVVATFETVMQQINAFGIINSSIRMEQPYSETLLLEIQIPNSVIEAVRKICKLDKLSHIEFLERLNKISQYRIEYKLKTSTGKMCYFMYIKSSAKIRINTPSLSDGNTNGQTKSDYEISFSCEVEFNYVDTMTVVSATELDDMCDYGEEIMKDMVIIPVLTTDTGLYVPQMNENDNSFYIASEILLDTLYSSDEDDTDITGLFTVFDLDNLREIAKADNISFAEAFNKYYDVELYEKEDKLEYGKDYVFDSNKLVLTILHPKSFTHYVVIVYRNNLAINSRIAKDNIYNEK